MIWFILDSQFYRCKIRNMSNRKSEAASADAVEDLASVFKALSNPNRLKIYLDMLPCMVPGEACVASQEEVEAFQRRIAERLGLAPSTVSHHLKELKIAGLIRMKRNGKTVEIIRTKEGLATMRAFVERSG